MLSRVVDVAVGRWLQALVVVSVVGSTFFLAFGLAVHWGSSEWGSYGQCVGSAFTLAAVLVALRESRRGQQQALIAQHSRLVDHELARRRECTKAISDVWAGLAVMSLEFKVLIIYFKDLPPQFNPNMPRTDQPPDKPDNPFAFDIGDRVAAFNVRWAATVEPPVFHALTILHGSPLYEPMRELVKLYRELVGGEDLLAVFNSGVFGRRPDTSKVNEMWTEVMSLRQSHLDLAREHFSLSLVDLEKAIQDGS
ncbi:hypothetical protein [Mycobacteroides chelonae]|uniref:hypothetical protein n=1 Tax=Mycobacteroides chelonae TaxID=1774 RepID=UPI0008A9D5FF|nr:hypothetical protein [Mycobacteroides chelonae]OHU37655.1 hypothetical protein BKG78_13500 [Mycobacteroides chelonae]